LMLRHRRPPPHSKAVPGEGEASRCWCRVRGLSSCLPAHAGPDRGSCTVRGRRREVSQASRNVEWPLHLPHTVWG
jgi:hypothetical protein